MKLLSLLLEYSFVGWELILDDKSQQLLKSRFPIPPNWKYHAHHMTIGILDKDIEGEIVKVKAIALGRIDDVIAVKIESPITTWKKTMDNDYDKSTPHITVATGPNGKPKQSNDITDWKPIKPFWLSGVIK